MSVSIFEELLSVAVGTVSVAVAQDNLLNWFKTKPGFNYWLWVVQGTISSVVFSFLTYKYYLQPTRVATITKSSDGTVSLLDN